MNLDALNARLADRYCIERELGQGEMATVYVPPGGLGRGMHVGAAVGFGAS